MISPYLLLRNSQLRVQIHEPQDQKHKLGDYKYELKDQEQELGN